MRTGRRLISQTRKGEIDKITAGVNISCFTGVLLDNVTLRVIYVYLALYLFSSDHLLSFNGCLVFCSGQKNSTDTKYK